MILSIKRDSLEEWKLPLVFLNFEEETNSYSDIVGASELF